MPLHVTIDGTRTIEPTNGDEKFTVYQVTVRGMMSPTHSSHTVDRRYREFEALHNRLPSNLTPPSLPRKVLLHRRSAKTVEQRRQALEIYLNEVLKRCQQHSTMPEQVSRFLQLAPYDDEIHEGNNPIEQQQHEIIDETMNNTLDHAPCISVGDRSPSNDQNRELLVDSVLLGLMHSMYDM